MNFGKAFLLGIAITGIVACLATGGSGVPVPDSEGNDLQGQVELREEDFYNKTQVQLDPVEGSLSDGKDKGDDDDADLTSSFPQEEVEKSDQDEDAMEAAAAPKLRVKRKIFLKFVCDLYENMCVHTSLRIISNF